MRRDRNELVDSNFSFHVARQKPQKAFRRTAWPRIQNYAFVFYGEDK